MDHVHALKNCRLEVLILLLRGLEVKWLELATDTYDTSAHSNSQEIPVLLVTVRQYQCS